ncbi:DUF115 domain-containing protein [Hydrogenobacter sp. T-2]|uniref:motility associated factor glycosyltransferase family protein n=1 Tax=Pampinifervens diazotrophicum TaxID=1632018 RepID=UPI002B25FB1A|nr:6-hydroxymethylpterin diphosphokinase MptE-like protein [Hydrogenobacter sp. T-2]WPM32370.1 DUF115 domain-containing protein [Hydrogenobacter sp. T-2]
MEIKEEFLKERVYKNHEFLRKKAPGILQLISSLPPNFSVIVKDGKLDADFGGGGIYKGDAYQLSLSQVQAFEEKPMRLFPDINLLEVSTQTDVIAHRYDYKIQSLIGNKVEPKPIRDTRHIPLLLMVGLGFGIHLELLLQKYEIQNLIILDVPAFFRLSLYYLDWEKLFEYYSKPGRSLNFIVHDKLILEQDLNIAFEELLRTAQQLNPGVFYWGYYFQHLEYNPPMRLIEWFSSSPAFQELFHGYFDDELWSLRWTLEKFKKKIPLYYPKKKVPKGSVAFVVGAGPSLDYAIDKIKEYKDKAVIFSCGTAISALQRAGIVPDFHVEIERTKYTYDTLIELDRNYLKQTRLIANNPLWTDCFKLFKRGYMFLKLNDTGALLLEPTGSPIIWHTGPTVTAAGVALAGEFGFEEVYLFGVDLGSKNVESHHSKLTNYYNPKSSLYRSKIDFDITVPGNFGGEVKTHLWFLNTKYGIEQTIKKKGIKVCNTSDGAKIEGAIPLPIEFFRLENSANKEEVIASIEENFDTRYINMVNVPEVLKRLQTDFETLSEYIRDYPKNYDFSKLNHAVYSFQDLVRKLVSFKNPLLYNLLYHNTHRWSQIALGHALSLEDEERKEFLREFYGLYHNFLKDAVKEIRELLEDFG